MVAVDAATRVDDAAPSRRRAPALDDSALAHLVGYRLARAQVPARHVFDRGVGTSLALQPVEFSMLQLLLANAVATPKQIVTALNLAPPKVTLLVDRLGERGLVRRERSAADGRGFDLRLTPAGHALAAQAQRHARTMEDAWLKVLSPAERALLLELLAKIARG